MPTTRSGSGNFVQWMLGAGPVGPHSNVANEWIRSIPENIHYPGVLDFGRLVPVLAVPHFAIQGAQEDQQEPAAVAIAQERSLMRYVPGRVFGRVN